MTTLSPLGDDPYELETCWKDLGHPRARRDEATAPLGDDPYELEACWKDLGHPRVRRDAPATSKTEERHGREEQDALSTWEDDGGAGPGCGR